jgi:RNAse (barnase) inhibitor barstar
MRELFLDGAQWKTSNDVYDSFFKVVGAPPWHGRNFNALNDSIAGGRINEVEVPYRLVIQNYNLIGVGAKKMVGDFIDLIHEVAARGCPVEIRTHNGKRTGASVDDRR